MSLLRTFDLLGLQSNHSLNHSTKWGFGVLGFWGFGARSVGPSGQWQRRRLHRGEGDEPTLQRFTERLVDEAPPLSRIFGIEVVDIALRHESGFRIVESHTLAARLRGAGRRGLRRLSGRDVRSRRPPLALSLHQLHQLRPPLHHHTPTPLRPPPHHHEDHLLLCATCAAEFNAPSRSSLPRPTRSLRPPAAHACGSKGPGGITPMARRRPSHPAGNTQWRRHRRHQGSGRLPPGLRCHVRRRPLEAASSQAPKWQAAGRSQF